MLLNLELATIQNLRGQKIDLLREVELLREIEVSWTMKIHPLVHLMVWMTHPPPRDVNIKEHRESLQHHHLETMDKTVPPHRGPRYQMQGPIHQLATTGTGKSGLMNLCRQLNAKKQNRLHGTAISFRVNLKLFMLLMLLCF